MLVKIFKGYGIPGSALPSTHKRLKKKQWFHVPLSLMSKDNETESSFFFNLSRFSIFGSIRFSR